MASRTGLFLRAFTLLAFSCVVFAAQENRGPVFSTYQGKGAELEVSKTGPEYTSIRFDGSNLERQTLVKDFENYDFIGIDGEAIITEDGAPALPHVSRFYRIPATGGVDLVVMNAEYELVENYNSLPYTEEGHEFRKESRNPMIYNRDEWYPANVAEMSDPLIIRDFRVVTVRINPVQVNPVTGQARIYRNVQVDVVPNDQPGINEIARVRRPAGSWTPIYQQLIENLDDSALDDATTTPGTYMIFARTNDQVNPWVDSLALWKKRSGHDVMVMQQANWSSSQIITEIRDTWLEAPDDSPLEFVCLMGDPQASWGLPVSGGSDYDHGYALANTGDDIEDIGVGRFCASSGTELANIYSKTVGYERTPHMADPTWFKKAFLYAGISLELTSNYTTFQWIGDMLKRNTEIDSVFLLTHSGNQVNPSDITGQLNQGRGIFLWRGSWIGGMGNEVAGQCNNGSRTPICLTVTCATGSFESGTSVSESWVLAGTSASPKGGVTGLGMATAGTHPPENLCVTGGLGYAIAVSETEHIGHCVNQGKAWLVPTFGAGSGQATNFTRWFNLMGDPGLSIWTDTPQIVDVTHSGSLNIGARSLAVHVADDVSGEPVEKALVTALKGTECFVKGLTDANGDVVLPIEVLTAGDLMLTVTKRNLRPYLVNIPCAAAQENVSLFSLVVDDDNANGTQGNGNGVANPGEIVDLGVMMQNSGTSVTVTGISAALTTTNPHATVVQGTSTYPNLAPGAQAMGATPFRLNLSNDLQHNEIVPLRFAVTSSGTPTTSSINYNIVAAKMDYVSHSFAGAFTPGQTRNLTVTVRNNGVVPLTGITATLISGSPFVAATVNMATYPDINPNSQTSNSASPFTLNSNSLTFPGHQARMTLILTGNGGFADTTYFNVAVGTASANDPCGPDAYGYYAYDNTDANYELHPTYNWTDISQGLGTNLNLADPGEKTSITQIFGVARQLPFPFRYYGIDYDTLTVTASGTLAFGNQAWADHFRNYPIPAQTSPRAMIAPYWDDLKTNGAGQGVWWYHDVANNRLIIQWKASAGGSGFSQANLNFQVILLGQDLTPTLDGNGRILLQYNDVTMNLSGAFGQEISGSTIGIHDESQTVGLQLAYRDQLSPGCASLVDSRAILITTDARNLFGAVTGTVVDEENGQNMTDVTVSIDGHNYSTTTDVNGNYFLSNVLIGEYTVRVHKPGYNDATTGSILVELDDTVTVNFSMLHPEIELSDNALTIAYPSQTSSSFDIINGGNGPLDYSIRMAYTQNGVEIENWDAVQHVDLSAPTSDFQMLGCEFVHDLWFVTGGSGPVGTNYIYRFNRAGEYVPPAIPQPSASAFGWYDLAYDGQYLYGSEDGTGEIVGIDLEGTVQATIPSPLNPTRAIAFDPALERFWVGDFTQNIYSIDRDGNIFAQIPNEGAEELAITGMAWWPQDPDGFKLYVFSRDGGANQTRVTKIHPVTYVREHVGVLEGTEYTAGGCAITSDYNDMMVTFGAVLQNNTGDRLGVYQMKFDQDWAQITPAAGAVPGADQREVVLSADLTGFRTAVHTLKLYLTNDVLDTLIEIPVTIDIAVSADDDPRDGLIPREYSLSQNYPNPFNPSTTIRYSLREAGETTLSVYNISGRKVADLVQGRQEAGAYTVNFDASSLPSGMYFYRLESGNYSQAAKMILLK